jgi:hypothetical protein
MSFVINEVSLQKLDDKMLQELFLKIRSKLNYASSNKGKSKSTLKGLQIEMCYLQREIEMRSKYKKEIKEKK